MTGDAIAEPLWQRAVALLSGSAPVALACHVTPDGDALGSMLALGLALARRGVPVVAGFAGSPQVSDTYRRLPGQELLVAEADFPAEPNVLVTCDTASVDRLDALAPAVTRAAEVVVIDHHERGDGYGTLRLVDPSAAATAVLADALIDRLAVPLDADIATCLYTGLSADTGSFKFAATTPQVHRLAARLLAAGARHEEVARALWDTHSFGYVRLLGRACERAVLEPGEVGGLGLVWTVIPQADMSAAGLGLADVDAVVDVVRTTAEAEVAVVVKADNDATLKVSTRSKGAVDVGGVCASLGGGGHRFAAGFTATGSVEQTVARLRAALGAAVPVAAAR